MKTEAITGLRQEVTIRMTSPKTYELTGEKTLAQLNPKELLLLAGATCAGMSAMHIMEAERFAPSRFEITLSGTLDTEVLQSVSVFTSFHVHYRVEGAHTHQEVQKADRAVRLAYEKYCGAAKMLGRIARIEMEVEIGGA